jgi:hypothetical protein
MVVGGAALLVFTVGLGGCSSLSPSCWRSIVRLVMVTMTFWWAKDVGQDCFIPQHEQYIIVQLLTQFYNFKYCITPQVDGTLLSLFYALTKSKINAKIC